MKSLIKTGMNGILEVVVLPASLLFRLLSLMGSRDECFAGWTQLLSLFPGRIGVLLRHAFMRQSAGGCQPDAHIGFGTIFSHANVSIGHTAYIGNYCSIGNVVIEEDALIASHVSIMNGCQQHGTADPDQLIREQPGICVPVTIGANSWIGERATIAASIGRNCIIGAGSLVLRPIPDDSVAVGVPAKVIRNRRAAPSNSGRTTPETAGTDNVDDTPISRVDFSVRCLDEIRK